VIRLKDAHRGERAVVISGGPSLLASGFDLSRLRDRGFVTFLETKALTPGFLRTGCEPDYYLMLFPDKAKDHSLQNFVFRSFLADYRIDPLLDPTHRQTAVEMREHFDEYFESWRPHRGPHKRYRWRPDVYLRDSPYDLLVRLPKSRVIVNRRLVDIHFPHFAYADRAHYFELAPDEPAFDHGKYFAPVEENGLVLVRCADTFLNSAAIGLYPLLAYLGFKEAYFIGMDMSMLGSFEFAAPYTFRSMAHFWWFMRRIGRVFNANYKQNGWLFARPQSEFDNLRMLWSQSPVTFTRVYDPWRHASRVDGIKTMTVAQFLNN
jgi:hypothetical protein